MRQETLNTTAKCVLRTNQRNFLDYIGVGPKWIVKRFRIQAALEWLDEHPFSFEFERRPQDLTNLAMTLGYYDLAHFSRDFRDTVGINPGAYRNPKSFSIEPETNK